MSHMGKNVFFSLDPSPVPSRVSQASKALILRRGLDTHAISIQEIIIMPSIIMPPKVPTAQELIDEG